MIAAITFAFSMLGFARTAMAQVSPRILRGVHVTPIARVAVWLDATREYQFTTSNLASGVDPVMHLVDAASMELAQDDDTNGVNPLITFSPSSTGSAYVVVRSYSPYTAGIGQVDTRSRLKGAATWPSWAPLASAAHFGGAVVELAENQREYWTVAVQAAAGGCPDTVLYTMNSIPYKINGFDDDSGVGRMDRVTRPWGSTTWSVLVGAYAASGTTDLVANDVTPDTDGDTLGASLEAALGTCDSSSDARCSFLPTTGNCGGGTLTTRCDSDRDGLSDFHETFGLDTPLAQDAMHLPAWGASPVRKDVFLQGDYVTAFGANPYTHALLAAVQIPYADAPQADIRNLTGNGIALHFDIGAIGDPCPSNRSLCGAWGKGGTATNSWLLPPERAGVFRHVQLFPGGGQSRGAPAWEFDASPNANVFVHELGHALGLSHGGHPKFDESDPTRRREYNCKPHYKSVMNYCYGLASDGFSTGQNTAIINPARLSESSSFGSFNASQLALGSGGLYRFPQADATGRVDWNRDDSMPQAGWVRGSFVVAGHGVNNWVQAQADEVADPSTVGVASPDLAAYGGRLFALYASAGRDKILYRSSPHNGNTHGGGCSTGACRAFEPCHAFSSTERTLITLAAGVTVRSIAAVPWNGTLVVAYLGSDAKVWIVRATGVSGDQLVGVAPGAAPVVTDASGLDVELSPMYVSTTAGYPAPEVLAVFYTRGSPSTHAFRYSLTPNDPLSAWSAAKEVTLTSGGGAIGGFVAAAVTVWPATSASAPLHHSDVGYACGVFPGGAAGSSVRLLCYDKASDKWNDLSAAFRNYATGAPGAVPPHDGRRPSIAFHTLRAAAGELATRDDEVAALGDGRVGQFYLALQQVGADDIVYISTVVSPTAPPSSALKIVGLEEGWPLKADLSVALYADRDVSAVKGISFNTHAAYSGAPLRDWLQVYGFVDGSYRAQLRAKNDFQVMELGICRGLRPASWCGTSNEWGYDF